METNIAIIRFAEIWIGYGITTAVAAYYGITFPWHKSHEGRYIFGLLASIWLVLTNSIFRILFPRQEWPIYVGMVLFAVFIVAMASVGWGLWCAAHGRKCLKRKRKVN